MNENRMKWLLNQNKSFRPSSYSTNMGFYYTRSISRNKEGWNIAASNNTFTKLDNGLISTHIKDVLKKNTSIELDKELTMYSKSPHEKAGHIVLSFHGKEKRNVGTNPYTPNKTPTRTRIQIGFIKKRKYSSRK